MNITLLTELLNHDGTIIDFARDHHCKKSYVDATVEQAAFALQEQFPEEQAVRGVVRVTAAGLLRADLLCPFVRKHVADLQHLAD